MEGGSEGEGERERERERGVGGGRRNRERERDTEARMDGREMGEETWRERERGRDKGTGDVARVFLGNAWQHGTSVLFLRASLRLFVARFNFLRRRRRRSRCRS